MVFQVLHFARIVDNIAMAARQIALIPDLSINELFTASELVSTTMMTFGIVVQLI